MLKLDSGASSLAWLLDGSSAGELIAKLLTGGFLPSILEPRRRVEQALYTAIMEANIGGVSTCLPRRRPAAEHSADVMRHSHQASVD